VSRVLLVCPEPLGHRQPAGVGIRFIEFARALRSAGHAIELLTPDGAAIEGCAAAIITPQSILEGSRRADVAIVQGHTANDFFAHNAGIPTVVDLYDPFIIENLHYSKHSTDEVFQHDHATLLRSLAGGDFFLCASETQRMFYLGLLLATGRLNPERFSSDSTLQSLITLAPFGVPARLQGDSSSSKGHRILFGGIYDWYDPQLAIDAVVQLREEFPDISLTFNRHPNAASTPQSKAEAVERYVKQHGLEGVIRFEPWTPYEARLAYYERFALALLTFPASLETDLSMRTRVYDYLWAGLPVVTSSARGTDEILERYDAGVVVAPNDAQAFAATLAALLHDPARLGVMSSGASRFVADNQWNHVLEPLLRFCANPRLDETKFQLVKSAEVKAVARPRTLLSRIKRKLGRLSNS
jgi:glycosyltransferase involved in cell wall biosynthesis